MTAKNDNDERPMAYSRLQSKYLYRDAYWKPDADRVILDLLDRIRKLEEAAG